ncbi:MAG: bifunctional folylpolyglutamate synthase/dihydrofolate synthase, partial [Bacteroidales bacterium]|nr:bifunctional folylpolyglutamate synthase/dihydrofolate synthase [Bacteroidales bacterium]
MTYTQSIRFLFESLPMYQRLGAAAYKANLNNTIDLLNHFHNPQCQFKAIHIAGTNGKGSVSHNLASILQEKGYIVGLYTSPHLKTFRERIRINGQMIDKKYICQFV